MLGSCGGSNCKHRRMDRPTCRCKMHRSTPVECPRSRFPGQASSEEVREVAAENLPMVRDVMFRTNDPCATIKYN